MRARRESHHNFVRGQNTFTDDNNKKQLRQQKMNIGQEKPRTVPDQRQGSPIQYDEQKSDGFDEPGKVKAEGKRRNWGEG